MAKTQVGLVLRRKTIEVVQVRHGFGGARLSKVVSVPIRGTDDAQVVEAIRTAVETAGVARQPIGVSLAAQDILLRSFTMPRLPKPERETAVRFEARKYTPFKIDDLVWNFHAKESRDAKQMRVAFVGVRAQAFARVQGWLAAAGVTPAFLEAQSVSLSRLALPRSKKSSEEGFVGLVEVDLEAGVAHLVVAKDGLPYFSRDVQLAMEQEGALEGSQATDLRVKVLLSELRLSLDFFARENPAASLHRLVLFGDAATIAPWASSLAEQLRCAVSLGTVPLKDQAGQDVRLHLACAVGLLLRDLQPNAIKLDFVERHAAPSGEGEAMAAAQPIADRFFGAVFGTVFNPEFLRAMRQPATTQFVVASAVVTLLTVLGYQPVMQAQAELTSTVNAFPDVGWGLKNRPRAEVEALKGLVDARLAVASNAIHRRMVATEKLNVLAKELPEGIWLDGLTYQDRFEPSGGRQAALTLQGSCFLSTPGGEVEVITQLARQLKQDPKFFQGFAASQLGEIATRDAGNQTSYRTFTLTYTSQKNS